MAVIENLVVAVYTVFALLVSVAAWRAWGYTRSHKVLFLASAFTLLLVKGVFLSIGLFWIPEWEALFVPRLALDLVVIVLFYFAVLRRSG